MLSLAHKWTISPARELGFALHDVARLLRTYSDQRARELGTTRAQWAVLSRLQRCEGTKQNELAEALDLAPITLGRLIDKLTAAGLVERRDDATDRRANRLYLTEKAAPALRDLGALAEDLMGRALAGARRIDHARHARRPHDHESQYQERIDCWSRIQVTQPKPSSARDPAQENDLPAASQPAQPLPFTPLEGRRLAVDRARIHIANAVGATALTAHSIHACADARSAPGPQAPPSAPPPPAAQTPITVKPKRRISRFIMLVVIPIAALALGFGWWLSSGRYVSTDNAYVGANKSLIAPQVTGAIAAVHVVEGQQGQGRRSALRH